MPICIECRHPVKTLWTQYSGAGDPSSGHNIRLTVCKNCGRFCDKYVEHDFVVLFIDLVLIKPQVYRHLLHNTLMRDHDQFDPSIIRLGTLLLLFDVYLTWARIEKQSAPGTGNHSNLGSLAQQPIVSQYMFFRSDSVYILNSCLPPLDPLPDLVALLAAESSGSDADILPPKLGIYGTPCQLVYETISNPHGDLGLRRARRSEELGMGSSTQQCRGAKDTLGLRISRSFSTGRCWSWIGQAVWRSGDGDILTGHDNE
ncbi:Arv1-like family protein [Seiridium cupressi]